MKTIPINRPLRILLVAPASGDWQGIARRRVFNGKSFRFSMLSLLSLAALSPDDAEIRIVDEQIESVPLDGDFDVVGITVMTALAPRAYELARQFRQRGVPVVLGGFHVTLNTQEALDHADAVVVGPPYGAWQRLLRDIRDGQLQRVYVGDLEGEIPARLPRHLLSRRNYATVNATFATLGCRNACRFCSIGAFHKRSRHQRPIEDVVNEVASFRERFFMFVDDNLTQDRDYALALLQALVPLRKKWVTQASIEVADDAELLTALREAGCVGVFVGLETFNLTALRSQSKELRPPDHYRQAVARLHQHGIFVEAGIIFGFDADEVTTFARTLRLLDDIGIDAIQVSILTPLPGTPLFEDLRDRITDMNWEHYNYRHVVFEPRRMTAAQLQSGADWVIARYYSPWRIARRALRWLRIPGGLRNLIYPLALNIAYFGRTRAFAIRGQDPSRYPTTVVASGKANDVHNTIFASSGANTIAGR